MTLISCCYFSLTSIRHLDQIVGRLLKSRSDLTIQSVRNTRSSVHVLGNSPSFQGIAQNKINSNLIHYIYLQDRYMQAILKCRKILQNTNCFNCWLHFHYISLYQTSALGKAQDQSNLGIPKLSIEKQKIGRNNEKKIHDEKIVRESYRVSLLQLIFY